MYNHASPDYKCPICIGILGEESEHTLIRQSDLVYRDDLVTAFISSFFIGNNNPGHVIVVPNDHYENIYDLPTSHAARIQEIAQKVALAIRSTYACDGITTLQNNEPAAGQHAFHFHMHVFPRYQDDNLLKNLSENRLTTPEERLPYAEKIKDIIIPY